MIYHITSQADWEAGLMQASYRPASLAAQGFIHCSQLDQVAATANRFYRGQAGLLLLCIDDNRLNSEMRLEPGSDLPDELFPHIYGPLNPSAVTAIYRLNPGQDGSFILPETIEPID